MVTVRAGDVEAVPAARGDFDVFADGGRLWFVSGSEAVAVDRAQQPTVFRLSSVDLDVCVDDCSPTDAIEFTQSIPTTAPRSEEATVPPPAPEITLPPNVPSTTSTTHHVVDRRPASAGDDLRRPTTTAAPSAAPVVAPPTTGVPATTSTTTSTTVPPPVTLALDPPPDVGPLEPAVTETTQPPRPAPPPQPLLPEPTTPPTAPSTTPPPTDLPPTTTLPPTTLPPTTLPTTTAEPTTTAAPRPIGLVLGFADGDHPTSARSVEVVYGVTGDAASCVGAAAESTIVTLTVTTSGGATVTSTPQVRFGEQQSTTVDVQPGTVTASLSACGQEATIERRVLGADPQLSAITAEPATVTAGSPFVATVGYTYGPAWSVTGATWTAGPCGAEVGLGGSAGPDTSSVTVPTSEPGRYCVSVVVSFRADDGAVRDDSAGAQLDALPTTTTSRPPPLDDVDDDHDHHDDHDATHDHDHDHQHHGPADDDRRRLVDRRTDRAADRPTDRPPTDRRRRPTAAADDCAASDDTARRRRRCRHHHVHDGRAVAMTAGDRR